MLHHERLKPPGQDYPPNEWSVIERSVSPEFIAQMESPRIGKWVPRHARNPEEGTLASRTAPS